MARGKEISKITKLPVRTVQDLKSKVLRVLINSGINAKEDLWLIVLNVKTAIYIL